MFSGNFIVRAESKTDIYLETYPCCVVHSNRVENVIVLCSRESGRESFPFHLQGAVPLVWSENQTLSVTSPGGDMYQSNYFWHGVNTIERYVISILLNAPMDGRVRNR